MTAPDPVFVRWEMTYTKAHGWSLGDDRLLDDLLATGWEPFAVTATSDDFPTVWLRREAHNDGSGAES